MAVDTRGPGGDPPPADGAGTAGSAGPGGTPAPPPKPPSALAGAARRDPATARRRRPLRIVAVVALVAGAVAVWELGAIHDDGPLLGGERWGWGSCQVRAEPGVVDFTIGGVLAEPSRDLVVVDVRAVRPRNVVVREGTALPFTGDRDGDGMRTIIGEGAGYPPADLSGTDVVWAQGDPLVGARLAHDAATNIVWRAEVQDASQDAGYEAVEIEYRSGHRRYVAVVQHTLLVPGGVDPEGCAAR